MRIKNPGMSGQAIRLRFSGERLELDATGSVDVPEKDGLFLCATPGWFEVKEKGGRQPAAPAVVPPPELPARESEAAITEPSPAVEDPSPVVEDAEGEDDGEDGPDIEGLRTKKAAMAVADDYGVDLDPDARLSEMKTRLDAVIYGDG